MRGVPNPKLKARCIALRIKKRLSLREIYEATGAPKGSLSAWLKPYPLTEEEKKKRVIIRRQGGWRKDRGVASKYYEMALKPLSKTCKARAAEAAVLFRMVLVDFKVFGSPFDGEKEDWVVLVPGKNAFVKVQVRSAKEGKHGLPFFSLRCSDGRRKARKLRDDEVDFLVGYNLFTDTAYVWSWEELKDRKATITIHPDALERWDKMCIQAGSSAG